MSWRLIKAVETAELASGGQQTEIKRQRQGSLGFVIHLYLGKGKKENQIATRLRSVEADAAAQLSQDWYSHTAFRKGSHSLLPQLTPRICYCGNVPELKKVKK